MGMNDRATDAKAERKASQRATKKGFADWAGFVDVEMTIADKAACRAETVDFDQIWHDVEDLVEEGYKLSVTFDDEHTTWNVSLTCRALKHTNSGYTMSARGGTFAAAVRAFWYKHFRMLEGNWANGSAKHSAQMALDDFA